MLFGGHRRQAEYIALTKYRLLEKPTSVDKCTRICTRLDCAAERFWLMGCPAARISNLELMALRYNCNRSTHASRTHRIRKHTQPHTHTPRVGRDSVQFRWPRECGLFKCALRAVRILDYRTRVAAFTCFIVSLNLGLFLSISYVYVVF